MKTTMLPSRNLTNRSPVRLIFLLIPFALLGVFLSPIARAVCQEGCLTNENTVLGEDALLNNTGFFSTAIGWQALRFNTNGTGNTAIGRNALFSNTSASNNTAIGLQALFSNTTGGAHTANGVDALLNNTTGGQNTATGVEALYSNTTGSGNIALGFHAGFSLTTGTRNIDIGNGGMAGESNTIRIGRAAEQTATFIAGIS